MNNKPLTREEVMRWSPEHGHGDPLRASVLALLDEREQLAAACDIFRGKIQVLELERDAARAEGARLRERVKVLEDLLQRACDDDRWDARAEKEARAALSPTTDGAPKPKCATCDGLRSVPAIEGVPFGDYVPCPTCKEKP